MRLDQDAAQPVPQGRLDRDLELLGCVDVVGHQPVDAGLRLRLHDRAGAALKAFVAVVDLAQRHQPRAAPVQLGAQGLDLGLARVERLGQQAFPALELLGPVAQIHAGLAQVGQAFGQALELALELAGAGAERRAVLDHLREAPGGVLAAAGQGLALALGPGQIGARLTSRPRAFSSSIWAVASSSRALPASRSRSAASALRASRSASAASSWARPAPASADSSAWRSASPRISPWADWARSSRSAASRRW